MRSVNPLSATRIPWLLMAILIPSGYAIGQLTPNIGWEAILSNDFHNVSGTVSVMDEDSLLVNDFTYDGGGIAVYFYLGAADTPSDFRAGLPISDDLLGMAFDGSQPALMLDLPASMRIDGYHAISVWCVAAGVSFGSGTFQPVPEPDASALLGMALVVGVFSLRQRKEPLPRQATGRPADSDMRPLNATLRANQKRFEFPTPAKT